MEIKVNKNIMEAGPSFPKGLYNTTRSGRANQKIVQALKDMEGKWAEKYPPKPNIFKDMKKAYNKQNAPADRDTTLAYDKSPQSYEVTISNDAPADITIKGNTLRADGTPDEHIFPKGQIDTYYFSADDKDVIDAQLKAFDTVPKVIIKTKLRKYHDSDRDMAAGDALLNKELHKSISKKIGNDTPEIIPKSAPKPAPSDVAPAAPVNLPEKRELYSVYKDYFDIDKIPEGYNSKTFFDLSRDIRKRSMGYFYKMPPKRQKEFDADNMLTDPVLIDYYHSQYSSEFPEFRRKKGLFKKALKFATDYDMWWKYYSNRYKKVFGAYPTYGHKFPEFELKTNEG